MNLINEIIDSEEKLNSKLPQHPFKLENFYCEKIEKKLCFTERLQSMNTVNVSQSNRIANLRTNSITDPGTVTSQKNYNLKNNHENDNIKEQLDSWMFSNDLKMHNKSKENGNKSPKVKLITCMSQRNLSYRQFMKPTVGTVCQFK